VPTPPAGGAGILFFIKNHYAKDGSRKSLVDQSIIAFSSSEAMERTSHPGIRLLSPSLRLYIEVGSVLHNGCYRLFYTRGQPEVKHQPVAVPFPLARMAADWTSMTSPGKGQHHEMRLSRDSALYRRVFGLRRLTYIGNGPNFMVKSIAEKSGVPMPSFFGYMAYSFVILLPILALVGIWLL